MKKTSWTFDQDWNSKSTRLIDELLLSIYSVMPSTGAYPFTMLRVTQADVKDFGISPEPTSCLQILVLKRTDFDYPDFIDYVTHTKEYSHIRLEDREAFLDDYKLRVADASAFSLWKDQLTSLGIGIIRQLARQKGFSLTSASVDLAELDAHFGFRSQHLAAHQIFNVSQNQ